MQLRIVNEPELFEKRIVRKAIRYYINRLIGEKHDNISLTVKFDNSLKEDHAYCMWLDVNYKPRKFKIVINSLMSQRRTLEILAHEMVHVKQYVTGELKDYIYGNKVRWNGQKMLYDETNDESYYDSPWEIEAYGRQIGLYIGFKEQFLKD